MTTKVVPVPSRTDKEQTPCGVINLIISDQRDVFIVLRGNEQAQENCGTAFLNGFAEMLKTILDAGHGIGKIRKLIEEGKLEIRDREDKEKALAMLERLAGVCGMDHISRRLSGIRCHKSRETSPWSCVDGLSKLLASMGGK